MLKGLEPVKQRPGMYTLTDNPLHIIQEVIDNASDEVLAGYGRRISVEVAADGSVTVEDDGRGIPTGMHPEEHAPVLEIVFTRLHAGGKFAKADDVQLRTSEHRSMYSYVRLSIDRCTSYVV